MTALTHDTKSASDGSRLTAGLLFALVSAVSFGLSGVLARGLLDTGWSPGAVVLTRVAVGALVVTPIGLVTLRGPWRLLRRNARLGGTHRGPGRGGAPLCFFPGGG